MYPSGRMQQRTQPPRIVGGGRFELEIPCAGPGRPARSLSAFVVREARPTDSRCRASCWTRRHRTQCTSTTAPWRYLVARTITQETRAGTIMTADRYRFAMPVAAADPFAYLPQASLPRGPGKSRGQVRMRSPCDIPRRNDHRQPAQHPHPGPVQLPQHPQPPRAAGACCSCMVSSRSLVPRLTDPADRLRSP